MTSYLINVWNVRAFVARREWSEGDKGYVVVPASNAEELEQDAIEAIEAQGGARNISGQYDCPSALAARAIWQEGA